MLRPPPRSNRTDTLFPNSTLCRSGYTTLLRACSASDYAKSIGLEQGPWWNKLTEHPAYDALWQVQALYKLRAPVPLKIPTMWLQGLWDQEDMYGANQDRKSTRLNSSH